ncbi:MAG: cytochrome c oxidase assembly protein [Actinomycetota bacterium]
MSTLLEAVPAAGMVLASYLYVRAYRRGGPVDTRRLLAFLLGAGLLVTALFSPLESVAGESLAAHMGQHVLLVLAPLPLLAARTGTAMLLGIDPALRARLTGRLRRLRPWLGKVERRPWAWAALAATLAIWHLPAIFQAAALSPLLHGLEHLTFLGAAGLWWMSLLGTGRRRARAYGASILSVFGTMLLGTAVGALLTFSTRPWYPLYAARVEAAGGDWLVDQQLAGLVMWIPPGVVLLGVCVWLAREWLESVDRSRPRKVPT